MDELKMKKYVEDYHAIYTLVRNNIISDEDKRHLTGLLLADIIISFEHLTNKENNNE